MVLFWSKVLKIAAFVHQQNLKNCLCSDKNKMELDDFCENEANFKLKLGTAAFCLGLSFFFVQMQTDLCSHIYQALICGKWSIDWLKSTIENRFKFIYANTRDSSLTLQHYSDPILLITFVILKCRRKRKKILYISSFEPHRNRSKSCENEKYFEKY